MPSPDPAASTVGAGVPLLDLAASTMGAGCPSRRCFGEEEAPLPPSLWPDGFPVGHSSDGELEGRRKVWRWSVRGGARVAPRLEQREREMLLWPIHFIYICCDERLKDMIKSTVPKLFLDSN